MPKTAAVLVLIAIVACARHEPAAVSPQPRQQHAPPAIPAPDTRGSVEPPGVSSTPYVHPIWRAQPKEPLDAVRNPAVRAIPRETPPPKYPGVAVKARVRGIVILDLVVDRTGRVAGGEVLKPLPFGLTQAAMEAVRQWKYEPARDESGRPVASRVVVTIPMRPPDAGGRGE